MKDASTLSEMVRSGAAIQEVANHLDALRPLERRGQTLALDGALQKLLYERALASPLLDLEFFVPAAVEDECEVIHYGRNSQPAFRYFQKRWSRPRGQSDRLFGYNEATVRPLIGPGYFVARPSDSDGSDVRGAVVVDYFMVPDAPVPANWPPIRPNHRGIQRFVYNKTRDYMRRISRHVSLGIAYRMEKRVMGYFVLCREDVD